MTITPSMAELLRRVMDARVSDVHVALPGRVVSYDEATQTADVEPQIKRAVRTDDGTKLLEDLPVLPRVPVSFPRVGAHSLTFPIAKDDSGTLVFNERSIDTWRATGRSSDPGDQRPHGLSGAVFFPGVFPSGSPLPAKALSATDTVLNAPAIQLGSTSAADFLVLGTALNTAWALRSGVLTVVPAATDLPTVITLANANKVAILGMIADLAAALSTKVRTE